MLDFKFVNYTLVAKFSSPALLAVTFIREVATSILTSALTDTSLTSWALPEKINHFRGQYNRISGIHVFRYFVQDELY
jgi:hypothetical protein